MKPVLLVNMPWREVDTPSIQIGLLKAVLAQRGIPADDVYANLWLLERLTLETYNRFARGEWPLLAGEWLFSNHLLNETNGPADVASEEAYLNFLEERWALPAADRDLLSEIRRGVIPGFLDDALDRIPWENYSIAGFSCVFSQAVPSLALTRRVKARHPNLKIVLGGAQCDHPMGEEYLRAFEWVDFVVIGYAEQSFPALILDLEAGGDGTGIPGVAARKAGSVTFRSDPVPADLNRLPPPDYKTYFSAISERTFTPRIPLESSRGCWWGQKSQCSFCGISPETMPFSGKSPEKVLSELEEETRRHRVLDFVFTDYILDYRAFNGLLPLLADHEAAWEFFFEVKANLKRHHVESLRRAGVTKLQPGIESLNSHVLTLMQKGSTAMQNIQLLRWITEFRLTVIYNILWGFPGETPEDYQKQLDLVASLIHLPPPQAEGPVVIHRFSPLFSGTAPVPVENIRPKDDYRFVFDARTVNIDRIAYEHQADPHPEAAELRPLYQELRRRLEQWREAYRSGEKTLTYRGGPGFLQIEDRRDGDRKIHDLGPAPAAVYKFCALQPRSSRSILAYLVDAGYPADAGWVDDMLDRFVDLRLCYREGGQTLSLAIPHRLSADSPQREEGRSIREAQATDPGPNLHQPTMAEFAKK